MFRKPINKKGYLLKYPFLLNIIKKLFLSGY